MTHITITSSEWTVLTKMLEVESEDVVAVPKGAVCVCDRETKDVTIGDGIKCTWTLYLNLVL